MREVSHDIVSDIKTRHVERSHWISLFYTDDPSFKCHSVAFIFPVNLYRSFFFVTGGGEQTRGKDTERIFCLSRKSR